MKFKDSALMMAGETAAFGWFILRGLSFMALIPLIPLGYLYYKIMKNREFRPLFLNGLTLFAAILFGSEVVGEGLFQGKGQLMLILLLLAVGLFGMHTSKKELMRVLRWWSVAFFILFLGMLFATLPGIRLEKSFPSIGSWWELLIFYLLVFAEPMSLGKDYAAAPFALGLLLIPFGAASYYALGDGAFHMAQYPYLSVWSGVSFFSIHHTEGIILGFYYGTVAFRCVEFLGSFPKKSCKAQGDVVK